MRNSITLRRPQDTTVKKVQSPGQEGQSQQPLQKRDPQATTVGAVRPVGRTACQPPERIHLAFHSCSGGEGVKGCRAKDRAGQSRAGRDDDLHGVDCC
jgi:hypothetical protein